MENEVIQREVAQLIPHDELIQMLPHKGKMFLQSRVTQHDVVGRTITSEYDVTENCLFYEEALGGVPSWVGIEFMAQGISALTGITNTMFSRTPRPGFLLSVVGFDAKVKSFPVGTTIQMKAKEDLKDGDVYRYDCELYANVGDAEPVITTKITVMETDDAGALFGDK